MTDRTGPTSNETKEGTAAADEVKAGDTVDSSDAEGVIEGGVCGSPCTLAMATNVQVLVLPVVTDDVVVAIKCNLGRSCEVTLNRRLHGHPFVIPLFWVGTYGIIKCINVSDDMLLDW